MEQESLAMGRALAALLAPDRVLTGPAVARSYDCDAYTVDRSPPRCVVLPESTEEVQAVVRWCRENGVPYTPRGAGTGLSGGAMAAQGGVILSTKRMTRILAIDLEDRLIHAQAGTVNARLSQAVANHGLHFAPDPSSQTVSTVGGNIAENSGGPHTLKYGVTARHVRQVTMVDSAGEIVRIGSRVAGAPGLDLLSVVVGSEGTVGIVTEAWLVLTPLPAHVETALIAFPTIRSATESVAAIIDAGVIPAAIEMMDKHVLVAVKAAFGLDYPAAAEALLLVECDGERDAAVREIEAAEAVARQCGAIDVQRARTPEERTKLWTARKKGIGAMGRLAPTIVTHDGVIPRSKLPEMLDFVYRVAEEADLGVANIFHAGDGNLHPCFYFDDRIPGVVDRVVEAGEKILRRCVELGGSATGEHGVGVEKLDLMKLMFSPADLALQADAKAIFAPDELLNPCKVLPDQKGCVEHMRRWRGAST